MRVHGTAIALGRCGVLLRGAPGSGKSSLALQLIDSVGYGIGSDLLQAKLIADDQVDIDAESGRLVLSAPQALAGLIEIRGWGITRAPHASKVELVLVADLAPASTLSRLPQPDELRVDIAGFQIPRLWLDPMVPGAPARLRSVLASHVAQGRKEA
jgi:serine kinase of HPr protein (carbohydrate metabolism regulator)